MAQDSRTIDIDAEVRDATPAAGIARPAAPAAPTRRIPRPGDWWRVRAHWLPGGEAILPVITAGEGLAPEGAGLDDPERWGFDVLVEGHARGVLPLEAFIGTHPIAPPSDEAAIELADAIEELAKQPNGIAALADPPAHVVKLSKAYKLKAAQPATQVAAAGKFLPAPTPALPPARRIDDELAEEAAEEVDDNGEAVIDDGSEQDEPARPLTKEEQDAAWDRAEREQYRQDLDNDPTDAHTVDTLLFDSAPERRGCPKRGEPGTEVTHEQHVLCMLVKAHEHAAYKLERKQYTPEAWASMRGVVEKLADLIDLAKKAVRKGWGPHQAKRAAKERAS